MTISNGIVIRKAEEEGKEYFGFDLFEVICDGKKPLAILSKKKGAKRVLVRYCDGSRPKQFSDFEKARALTIASLVMEV